MTTNRNAPVTGQVTKGANQNDSIHYNRNQPQPLFPANGKHAHHARAALVLMLKGGKWDQYEYNRRTGFPCTDYRTRISDLGKMGWKIDREFHLGIDHDGAIRKCKHYWLKPEAMRELFEQFPEFAERCRLLMDKGVGYAQ
ncbi:hypothetical protein [Marinobacter sp.]|uniref:hypothetical protein n=1 Tax=Marinobacter sp. TaxID=50741 RepID=UPI003561FCA1